MRAAQTGPAALALWLWPNGTAVAEAPRAALGRGTGGVDLVRPYKTQVFKSPAKHGIAPEKPPQTWVRGAASRASSPRPQLPPPSPQSLWFYKKKP
jgi:hypothetical protein